MRWLPVVLLPFVIACTHSVIGTGERDDDETPSSSDDSNPDSNPSNPAPKPQNPTADGDGTADSPDPEELALTGDYCGAAASSVAACKAGYGAYLHLVATGSNVTGMFCSPGGGACSPLEQGSSDGSNVYFEALLEDGVGAFDLTLNPAGDLEGTIEVPPYPSEGAELYRIR